MKLHFGYLLGFSALAIAGCAAVFSVYGIGQLFSGAMIAVIIMASALELGKLVTASYLQRYWLKINGLMKVYLIIGVLFLMAITSGGIYGFLSSAYQETFQKLTVVENEIAFLEQKENFYSDDVARYDRELDRISESINNLSDAKVTSIQVRDENTESGIRNTISTAELRLAQKRIAVEEENRKEIISKRNIASDSLQKYQMIILEKKNNSELSGELGPLKYIAQLTGISMDEVVNYFILIFIIVFDPLAITLVIATNWVFKEESDKNVDKDELLKKEGKVSKKRNVLKKIFKAKKKNKVKLNDKPLNDLKTENLNFNDLKEGIKKTRKKAIKISGGSGSEVSNKSISEIENEPPNNDVIFKETQPIKGVSELTSGNTESTSGNTESTSGNTESTVARAIKTINEDVLKDNKKNRFNSDEIKEIRHNARNITRKIPNKGGY